MTNESVEDFLSQYVYIGNKVFQKSNCSKQFIIKSWYPACHREHHNCMKEQKYPKIKDFNISTIDYLKVSLEIIEKEKFIKTIARLYDKKN